MLDWALTAVALLLFGLAVRTVFASARAKEEGRKRLGCGFALVAVALWTWALGRHFGSPWPPLRIGLALFLVLPAVEAIARPEKARWMRAALGLFLAVLLAGQPLATLWERYGPDPRSARERELAERVDELEDAREELVRRRDALAGRRDELRGDLLVPGRTFEEIEADPELLADLETLVVVDEAWREAEASLARVDAALPALREALAAEERGRAAPPTEEDEVEALLRALEEVPSLERRSLVEREARKLELEAWFEAERE